MIDVMQTRITVNGVEYNSVDQMPPDVRRQYERAMGTLADTDRNGVPDILEGGMASSLTSRSSRDPEVVSTVVTSSKIVVNGREYARWEDVPPEIRRLVQSAGAGNAALPDGSTSARNLTFDVGLSTAREKRLHRALDNGNDAGGITIRLTWSVLLALIAAVAVTAVLAWWMMR
jgi:hypothetical protein